MHFCLAKLMTYVYGNHYGMSFQCYHIYYIVTMMLFQPLFISFAVKYHLLKVPALVHNVVSFEAAEACRFLNTNIDAHSPAKMTFKGFRVN